MSNDQENVRDRQINEFIHNLSQLDDGERARLKRNAGNSLAEAHQVRLLFYQKILPYGVTAQWQEERYFLIATLYPFDKKQRGEDRQPGSKADEPLAEVESSRSYGKSLGASFRLALRETNQTGLDRRFARLLDADAQQLPFQLRQAVMRLTSDWVPIDWAQLTRDILAWESSSRYVQRKWARDYTAYTPETQTPS
jgi:CRISPR type I-E-associated protein CasB/Cse2